MAKTAFSEAQVQSIVLAKRMLRGLWLKSGLKQQEVLQGLQRAGLEVKKNTLSNWLSDVEDNAKRPAQQALMPLLQIICAHDSQDSRLALHNDLSRLLGYATAGPKSREVVLNHIADQVNERLLQRLREQQGRLLETFPPLLELLEDLQTHIFEYDKGYPVIRMEAYELSSLRQLLGTDTDIHKRYRVGQGYEIPLTHVQSLETITALTDLLHEGARLLRAYVEKALLQSSALSLDLPLFEDLLDYIWEIVNRLLLNQVCQRTEGIRQTLLTVVATAWGVRFLLQAQQGQVQLTHFQNILQLKGKGSQADIQCSSAVYVGVLARHLFQQARQRASETILQRALLFMRQALEMLTQHHETLSKEQDIYFYKKEIANLYYDCASLLLWFQDSPAFATHFQTLMQQAHTYYAQVLDTVNLFSQGLSEARATHIRIFYVLSQAWTANPPDIVRAALNLLSAGSQLNDLFWTVSMAKALGYGILALRTQSPEFAADYRQAAHDHLERARLVPGMGTATTHELESDYVLQHIFARPEAPQSLGILP